MKVITDESCASYSSRGHPERPARITGTLDELRSQTELPITWASPGFANEETIIRAHSPQLLARLEEPHDFDADTPYHTGLSTFARASAGAALTALQCARNGETVFSLMRPPGHHAMHNRAMGFCYLNNIAIAVLEALANGVDRVAVYDFDVHHGNGTEDILMNRKGTLFASIHQHPCYPGTGTRNVGDNCLNYPVPERTPRGQYRQILGSALDEVQKFKPELVAVSAGFDAYARDPLAQETLEAEDFYWLGRNIRDLGVPAFSLLEGGYSKDLPELILAYLKGLDGR